MEIFGIDVGFGFTKATDGKEFVIFKSLLGEATDIQFQMNMGTRSFLDHLHVSINGQSFFVGDFADQQSNVRQFTLDQDKLVSEFVKILALTALSNLTEKYVPVNIVSGLPVSYYKDYHKKFMKEVKGHHDIVFHHQDGSTTTRRLNVNKVRMMPQPLGSVFNLLLDENGTIANKELTKQKIGVVDIGFQTTDFSVFDKLRYVERGSSTTDTGISKMFGVIAKKLRADCGVSVELYRMYKAVETGFIKIRGKEYNISGLRDRVYAHAAGIIANEINRLWADDWDMDAVILTGGGSVELAKFLQPLIDGNVVPIPSNIDARLNNVQGYLKYGKFEWGQQAASAGAAADAPAADAGENK